MAASLVIPHPGEKVIEIICGTCGSVQQYTIEPGEVEGQLTILLCNCYVDTELHLRYLPTNDIEKPTWLVLPQKRYSA